MYNRYEVFETDTFCILIKTFNNSIKAVFRVKTNKKSTNQIENSTFIIEKLVLIDLLN